MTVAGEEREEDKKVGILVGEEKSNNKSAGGSVLKLHGHLGLRTVERAFRTPSTVPPPHTTSLHSSKRHNSLYTTSTSSSLLLRTPSCLQQHTQLSVVIGRCLQPALFGTPCVPSGSVGHGRTPDQRSLVQVDNHRLLLVQVVPSLLSEVFRHRAGLKGAYHLGPVASCFRPSLSPVSTSAYKPIRWVSKCKRPGGNVE